MKIDVNQKKITIGDKYDIFLNEEHSYSASTELFKFLAVINLFNNEDSRSRMTMKKKFSWRGPKYELVRYDKNGFIFKPVSVWKFHYQCQVEDNVYDIYGHRGRKYSIYKNNIQVAWWDKKAVTWFKGDNYTIIADDDSDHELIICFCLIIDNYASKDHNETVTIDIGNIGFQAKRFDTNWRPAYK